MSSYLRLQGPINYNDFLNGYQVLKNTCLTHSLPTKSSCSDFILCQKRCAENPTLRRNPSPSCAWSDVRAVFGAVLLAEPEGPPALSAAGGVWVVGGRWRRCGPLAAAPATAPALARGPQLATTMILFTPQNDTAGSTAGKDGAGHGAVAATGAPPPEAGQASTLKRRQYSQGWNRGARHHRSSHPKIFGDFHPVAVG